MAIEFSEVCILYAPCPPDRKKPIPPLLRIDVDTPLMPPYNVSTCWIDWGLLSSNYLLHGYRVVPSRLHRGHELGQQLLPLPLPRLQLLDPSEHLALESGHVEVGS